MQTIEAAERTMEHSKLLWFDTQDVGCRCNSPSVWVVSKAFPESCPKVSLHCGGETRIDLDPLSNFFWFPF